MTDNAGGTASSVFTMTGTADDDKMGLWDSTNLDFQIKDPGVYLCCVSLPSSSGAVVVPKLNGVNIGNIGATANNYSMAPIPVYCNRGDKVSFVLAAGSYTRSGVVFGVSKA